MRIRAHTFARALSRPRARAGVLAGPVACFVVAILAGAALPARADVVESEPNDTIGTANAVDFAAEVMDGVVLVDGTRSAMDADFFRFTNLVPGRDYEVENDAIILGIGIFSAAGTLLDSVAFTSPQILVGTADGNGELIVAVCGREGNEQVLDCSTAGQGTSPYTLTVPEPGDGWLAAAALLAAALLARRQGR